MEPPSVPPASAPLSPSDTHPGDRFSERQKAGILALTSLLSVLALFEGAIFTPCLLAVQKAFGVSPEVANMSITSYLVATALAPLLWGTLSERLGRKPIYVVSMAICLVSSVALVFSPKFNIGWLIGWRAVQGCGACAAFSVGAGTIADIYRIEQRGRAIGIWTIGPLLGAIIGPVIGGPVSESWGWEYVFAVVAVLTFVLLAAIVLFMPETLPSLAEGQARPKINPFSAFPALRHLFVDIPIYAQSLALGAMYSFISMIARQLYEVYGYTETATGVYALALGIGQLFGSLAGGVIADFLFNRAQVKVSETRLRACYIGCVATGTSYIAWAWLTYYGVHVAPGLVFQFIIGFASCLIFTPTMTYLIDIYIMEAASISAISNLFRLAASAITPLFSPAMEAALGIGWMYTVWGLLIAFTILPLIWLQEKVLWKTRLRTAPWSEGADAGLGKVVDEEVQVEGKVITERDSGVSVEKEVKE
ncbi:major facilitator superfamily domain-containing protein [Hyaloraphidium curvatum]|nr:major facilitator superfamily domain-containing protein [Hyaloraphidium curvatum]